MKQLSPLLLLTLMFLNVQSQVDNDKTGKTGARFFAGISYSYSSFETDLNSLSYQSVWYQQDLGTVTYDDDELDEMNKKTTEMNYYQHLAVEPGMVFLNTGKWYFEGRLIFGISRVKFKTTIDEPTANRKEVTSQFNDPAGGLSFNLRYNFSERWGLTLAPHFIYTWGKAENIADSIRPFVSFFENDLKEDFCLGYGRLNLMVSYITSKVVISAGPGVYYSFSRNTLSIDRINTETMDEYHDQIASSHSGKAFIDACLRADWTIIDPLTLSVEAAVGNDLFMKTGLRFNF